MIISVSVFRIYFFPQVISTNLRLDKGTETGYMATIHSYLRQQGDAASNGTDVVHYGSSTTNKVLLCAWFIVKFKLIHTSKGQFLTKSSILS